MFHEARVAALDLDTAAGFLLDMLDVSSAVTDDLSSEVKAGNGLQINRNTLFWPFTPTKFVTFDLLWFTSSKPPLVDQIRQLLLHELLDLFDGFLQTGFCNTCDMEIQWRVLNCMSTRFLYIQGPELTAAVAMLLSG